MPFCYSDQVSKGSFDLNVFPCFLGVGVIASNGGGMALRYSEDSQTWLFLGANERRAKSLESVTHPLLTETDGSSVTHAPGHPA
jgi:hypothetical protein